MSLDAPFLNAPLNAVQWAALWLLAHRVALRETHLAMARVLTRRLRGTP